MAEALEETRGATFELVDTLAGYGLTRPGANMGIGSCEDLGRMSQPSSSGRLLHPDGRFSTIDDARQILELFVDDGWEPVESDRFEGGIEDLGADRFIVSVRRDELSARVGLWTDQPYVLFNVWGACLPNTEEEHDLYIAIGDWDLLGPAAITESAAAPEMTATTGSG